MGQEISRLLEQGIGSISRTDDEEQRSEEAEILHDVEELLVPGVHDWFSCTSRASLPAGHRFPG
jgi:hypothetical protein